MKPLRVQLSRKKGWRIPPNTVVVSRPSRWGNPCVVTPETTRAQAVEAFKAMLRAGKTAPFALANIREELSGRNLACWCPLNEPCHADVLLELANFEENSVNESGNAKPTVWKA